MKNITGTPVTHKDFLKTRLPLVDELRNLLRNSSVIIEAPRRTGKTSLVKELIRQEESVNKEEQEFKILFFDLESEETVNDFCFKLFKQLLELYTLRRKVNNLSNILGRAWNSISSILPKIKLPGFEIELRSTTKNYNFSKWKKRITPLMTHLNSFDQKTIFVFDEFPVDKVKSIYKIMLRKGNHDLNHFHSRLEEYLTPLEREFSDVCV